MEIPNGPQSLTPVWLTSALRESGAIQQASVKSFTSNSVKLDQGITGELTRLSLRYDIEEDSAPLSLIAKFPTTNPDELETMFAQTWHYEREVGFYQHIANTIALNTPRCYHADIDVEARQYILLLEDLAPAHSANSEQGCSAQEAQLAISEIAKLHAVWWEHPQLNSVATSLPQWDMRHFGLFQDIYQNGWPSFVAKMGARLTPDLARLGERLGGHFAALMDTNRQAPRTLTHYDYQLDNIFFPQPVTYDSLIIVDWQMTTIGRGAFDISTLLGGNMDPNERANVELDLVKMYHESLLEKGVGEYPLLSCLEDYRYSMLNHLARHIIVTILMDLTPEMEHRFLDIFIPRYFDAVLFLQAEELLSD